MRLLSLQLDDQESPVSDLYLHIKQCLLYLGMQNNLSLKRVQAELLIAVYEMGHAIYPAAYLTVGQCVRLGHALNLQDLTAPYRFEKIHRESRLQVYV